jgi:hypothetical protein
MLPVMVISMIAAQVAARKLVDADRDLHEDAPEGLEGGAAPDRALWGRTTRSERCSSVAIDRAPRRREPIVVEGSTRTIVDRSGS